MSVRYLLSRIVQMVIVMWLVSTIVFFIFHVLPGDQAAVLLGKGATDQAREVLREQLGLNEPLVVQYFSWLGGIVQGDLGTAFGYGGVPVSGLLGEALVRSYELALIAMVLAICLAVPLGIRAAARAGSWMDHLTRGLAVAGFSLPSFWLGILMLLLFSATLGWFPPGGYVSFADDPLGHLTRLVLPALTVGAIQTGVLVRFMRASMVEVLQEDYIRTARAKGLSQRKVTYKHALRNSALTFVTVAGIQFGLLLGGMIVVETVFAWPGVGYLIVQALTNRSYAVVQGAVLATAAVFVLVNTVVDIAYAALDPRIRYA